MSTKTNRTVLLIDDSPDDIEYYSRLLHRASGEYKYNVLTAQDAKAGLALFESNEVDCSLVDYNLPDQDGLETVVALQKSNNNQTTPVVILTGEPTQEVQAEAARSSALDYVAKDAITSSTQLERIIHKTIQWSTSVETH